MRLIISGFFSTIPEAPEEMITPNLLHILLPRAAAWVEKQEKTILCEGVPFTATTLADPWTRLIVAVEVSAVTQNQPRRVE